MSSRPRAAPLSADERNQNPLSFSKKSKLVIAVFAMQDALMNWKTSIGIVEAVFCEPALTVLTWCESLMSYRPRAAPLSADERHQKALVDLEQRVRDRGLRGAVSSSALKNITQIRSSLPP